MSESVETPETTEASASTEQQVDPAVAQVTQVINNAIAALMDVANLLRDIPKLVAVNQQLVGRLREAGLLGEQPKA
jgi:hypothetical protein